MNFEKKIEFGQPSSEDAAEKQATEYPYDKWEEEDGELRLSLESDDDFLRMSGRMNRLEINPSKASEKAITYLRGYFNSYIEKNDEEKDPTNLEIAQENVKKLKEMLESYNKLGG